MDTHNMPEQVETTEQRVKIGSKVFVRLDGDRLLSLTIGHPHEGNPDRGVISCDTPLAKALLGRQTGETTTYVAGDRIHEARITGIELTK